ncbi:MAG: cyclic nucleotide-binding domain-containing protein [Methylobacter sp.]
MAMEKTVRPLGVFNHVRIVRPTLFSVCIILAGLWIETHYGILQYNETDGQYHAHNVPGALYVILATMTGAVFISRLLIVYIWMGLLERRRSYRTPNLINTLSNIVVYFCAVLVIMHLVLGIPLASFSISTSVLLMVVGLAFRPILTDLFSGLFLDLQRPFQSGDRLEVYVRGMRRPVARGKVVEMHWRETRLLNVNNEMMIVPNGLMATSVLKNLSKPDLPVRRSLNVELGHEIPPERALRILKAAIMSNQNVSNPAVFISRITEKGVLYTLKYRIPATNKGMTNKTKIAANVIRYCALAGILMPIEAREVIITGKREAAVDRLADIGLLMERIEIFDGLHEDEKKQLAAKVEYKFVEANGLLFTQGELGDCLYVLVEGLLDVIIADEKGTEHVVGRIEPGDYVGEMSLLTGEPRSATICARTDSALIQVCKEHLEPILNSRPDLVETFGKNMDKRQAKTSETIFATGDGEDLAESKSNISEIVNRIKRFFAVR